MLNRDTSNIIAMALLGESANEESLRPFTSRDWENSDALVAALLNSGHVANNFRSSLDIGQWIAPHVVPPRRVDCEADEQQLSKLVERIRQEWEEFGREEPHWSVLTSDDFKQDRLSDHEEAFFASGQQVRDIVVSFLQREGIEPSSLTTCFELGCGVGRITGHLAREFDKVVAADISSAHLAVAREEMQKRGLTNVDFRLLASPAEIRQLPDFDLFVSFIVLQHNPPPVISFLLDQILGKLRPGGVAVFQVPTLAMNYAFDLDHYLAHPEAPFMEMHFLPQRHLFELLARHGVRLREIREDSWAGARDVSVSNTIMAIKD